MLWSGARSSAALAWCFFIVGKCSILSSSKLETCLNNGEDDLDCEKKVVLTITLEHGSLQTEQAQFLIEEVTDESNTVRPLQKPWRVSWTKTPAFFRYSLRYVQDVNNNPGEQIIQVGWLQCEANPAQPDSDQTCGVATLQGQRVIDSEGFCCSCDPGDIISGSPTRADLDCNILSLSESAHCLAWDSLWYSVFDVDRPQVFYDISVTLAKPVNPGDGWDTVQYVEERLHLSHQQPVAASSGGDLRIELVGDLATAVAPHRFDSDYLVIPSRPSTHSRVNLLRPLEHAMLIDKSKFDLSGQSCDKIGVSYTAFKYQPNACDRPPLSCLANQLEDLYKEDTDRLAGGDASQYLVKGFCEGAVELGKQQDGVSGETRFLACPMRQRHTTILRLEARAQDVMFVKNVASGRIVHAYIDSFEALSRTGKADVEVVSTGKVAADFLLGVANCTGGFEMSPAVALALRPYESGSHRFDVISSHTGGGDYTCLASLYNSIGDVVDTKVIYFNVTRMEQTNGAQAGNTRSGSADDGWFIGPSDCTALCPFIFDLPCALAHSCWSRVIALLTVLGIICCCAFACCKAGAFTRTAQWLMTASEASDKQRRTSGKDHRRTSGKDHQRTSGKEQPPAKAVQQPVPATTPMPMPVPMVVGPTLLQQPPVYIGSKPGAMPGGGLAPPAMSKYAQPGPVVYAHDPGQRAIAAGQVPVATQPVQLGLHYSGGIAGGNVVGAQVPIASRPVQLGLPYEQRQHRSADPANPSNGADDGLLQRLRLLSKKWQRQ